MSGARGGAVIEGGKLGKYVVIGTLGKGAMGTVYDGRDPVIDRRVAIKTIPLPDSEDSEAQEEIARFRREAQAAGRLQHPNIVGIYDYGETETLAYIVLEFVDGTSLKQMLEKQERFAPADAVRVLTGLLAGLQYSHAAGVVHRDIKPANVMITRLGVVKIADFGIARIESSSLTQAGTIMGTPAYMSPEQFMGMTVDARTDIYSAGVLLYQMLTGERPFEGSMTTIMHKVLNLVPPRPSELSVTAPPALDEVVVRAMAKRPEARFADATAFAEALQAAMIAPVPAAEPDQDATRVARPPPGPPPGSSPVIPKAAPPPAEPRKKTPVALLIGVGVAMLAVLGGGGYVLLGRPAPAIRPVVVATAPATKLPASEPTPTPPSGAASPPVATTPPVLAPVVPAPVVPAPVVPAPAVPEPVVPEPVVPVPPAEPQEESEGESHDLLRHALAGAVAALPCGLVGGTLHDDGTVTLRGFVPKGTTSQALAAVRHLAPDAAIDNRLVSFTGPYCGLLDVVRPLATAFGYRPRGLDLSLENGARRLRADEYIIPRIQVLGAPAVLQVDYFSSDGSLSHLHQPADDHDRPTPAGGIMVLGNPADGAKGWQVTEPFGTDLLVAIASDKPLFDKPRPADDTAMAYVHDLRVAIEAARQRGERVHARAFVVETAK